MASEHLRKRLEQLSDEELIDILRRHDTGEWQEVVFSTAAEVLRSRGIEPPLGQAAACGTELANAEPKLVPVANFATVVEAEACRSALLAAGFSVVGEDQFLLGVDPALGPAL